MTYPDGEIVATATTPPASRPGSRRSTRRGIGSPTTSERSSTTCAGGRSRSSAATSRRTASNTTAPSENFALARISSRSRSATVLYPRDVYSDLQYRDYDANGRLAAGRRRAGRGGRALDDGPATPTTRSVGSTTVSGASPESFAYDGIGNLRSIDGVPSRSRRVAARISAPISSIASAIRRSIHWTLAFDENGRRTGKRRSDGAVVESYAYDAFGALRVHGRQRRRSRSWATTTTGRRVVETRDGMTRRFFGRHAELVNGRLVKYYYVGDQLVATRTGEAAAMASSAGEGVVRFVVSPPVRIAVIGVGGAAAARADRPLAAGARCPRRAERRARLEPARAEPLAPGRRAVARLRRAGVDPSLPPEPSRQSRRDHGRRGRARAPVSLFGLRQGPSLRRRGPARRVPTRRAAGSSRATRRTRPRDSSTPAAASTIRSSRAS